MIVEEIEQVQIAVHTLRSRIYQQLSMMGRIKMMAVHAALDDLADLAKHEERSKFRQFSDEPQHRALAASMKAEEMESHD
jgi:hypothetical protein